MSEGEAGSGRAVGIIVTIVLLVGVNILSSVFDWGFWIY